jgi:hypothetical protein
LTAPFIAPLVSTIVPAAVLLVLQWINWAVIADKNSDFGAYFTNAITIVLALVVVIPQMRDSSNSLRNRVSAIDAMIFFFFLGTVLSAFPDLNTALIGLLITSGSLIFPAFGIGTYAAKVNWIRSSLFKIEDLLAGSSKGENLDFEKVKVREHDYKKDRPAFGGPIKFNGCMWPPCRLNNVKAADPKKKLDKTDGSKKNIEVGDVKPI